MPKLTAAEIALQEKYAELRRKKEQKKLAAAGGQQSAPANAGSQATAKPANAVDKAKALLAQKKAATPKEEAPTTDTKKLDPVEAAKRALEAKKSKTVAVKRPTLKRPSAKPAAKSAKGTDGSGSAKDQARPQDGDRIKHEQARHHTENARPSYDAHRDMHEDSGWGHPAHEMDQGRSKRFRHTEDVVPTQEHIQGESTLFVGDLPPYHTKEALLDVFSSFGPVDSIRLMRDQCYAFVKFDSIETAERALEACHHKPLIIAGHELRVNQSYGTLPDWKKALPGGGVSGPSQHPKVLEARRQGDIIADTLEANQMLSHGVDFYGKLQEREIVAYDDL